MATTIDCHGQWPSPLPSIDPQINGDRHRQHQWRPPSPAPSPVGRWSAAADGGVGVLTCDWASVVCELGGSGSWRKMM
ncbi:hypothetical protein Dimus_032003, partial [Dionaea muscipula]